MFGQQVLLTAQLSALGRARKARDIPSHAPFSVPVSRLDSRLRIIVIVQTRGEGLSYENDGDDRRLA